MEPQSLSCRQYVTLEHGTCLHSCRVGDISSRFFTLPPWVWVILFYLSSALFLVAMTSDPLMSNTAKLTIVSFICSREVDLCKYQPSSDSHLILIHKDIMFLYLVSMMWETLWPTFDQSHFLSTSAHYPGSWSRDSLLVPWSLHASMAGSSHLTWGFQHWPSIEWFCGCSTSNHYSHSVDCTFYTLRIIFIIGVFSRVY